MRITPDGAITEFPLAGLQKTQSITIASGPDGNLWFTEQNNPRNKVARLTPKSELTEFASPTTFSGPTGITVGPDGNLWFTENNKAKVARLQTAEKDVNYVLYLPSGFLPNRMTLVPGQQVEWVNQMPGMSQIKNATFDSGPKGTGSLFRFIFGVAGTYQYVDEAHSSYGGTITVPMSVSPGSATKTTSFTVTWAGGPEPTVPSGCVIDVQVMVPGAKDFADWQAGVLTKSANYVPSAAEGVYRFRARLRNSASGKACDCSPEVSISVR